MVRKLSRQASNLCLTGSSRLSLTATPVGNALGMLECNEGAQMDEQLAQRIGVFVAAGTVDPDIGSLVRSVLELLEQRGFVVTEETAGTLTSHLLLAYQRCRSEELSTLGISDVDQAELASHADAISLAMSICELGAVRCQLSLPDGERQYLALHLAALALRSSRPAERA